MKDFSPLAFTAAVMGYPANIGVITLMDGTIIRFVESDTAITVLGDTFAVIPGLSVSAIKHTDNGEMPSCEIVAVYGLGATFDSDLIDSGLFDGAAVQIYVVDRLNPTRKGLKFTGAPGIVRCKGASVICENIDDGEAESDVPHGPVFNFMPTK